MPNRMKFGSETKTLAKKTVGKRSIGNFFSLNFYLKSPFLIVPAENPWKIICAEAEFNSEKQLIKKASKPGRLDAFTNYKPKTREKLHLLRKKISKGYKNFFCINQILPGYLLSFAQVLFFIDNFVYQSHKLTSI